MIDVIPSAPRRAPLASPLKLVGTRYTRGGVTPETGFDCYSLLCYVRWQWFHRRTPFAGIPARKLTCAQACAIGIRRALTDHPDWVSPWLRQDVPTAGCAVALAHTRFARLHHCGVWIEGAQGGVLHASEVLGVAFIGSDRLRDLFGRVEFYECAGLTE